MEKRAFVQGFLQGFGNVGQVYEPIVGGMDVIRESKKPVSIEIVRRSVKQTPAYKQYIKKRLGKRLTPGAGVGRTLVER